METVSKVAIMDDLSNAKERFASLKDIIIDSYEEISSDNHTLELLVNKGDKEQVLKIFLNEGSERAERIIDTHNIAKNRNYHFIDNKAIIYPNELMVISNDGFSSKSITTMLIDIPSTDIMSYISENDDISKVINAYAQFIIETLSRGILFDIISVNHLRYNSNGSVTLSPTSNYIFSNATPVGANNHTKAMINYYIGLLLRLTIECHNEERGYDKIDYPRLRDKFDSRLTEEYLNSKYIDWLNHLIDIVERECERNCTLIREVIGSTSVEELKAAIEAFTATVIAPTLPLLDKRYEIIGNHAEGCISVRDGELELFGYINYNMELVIECTYNTVTDFSEDIAVCSKNDLYGAINRKGEVVVPFEYNHLEWDVAEGRFICEKDGNEFYFNRYE